MGEVFGGGFWCREACCRPGRVGGLRWAGDAAARDGIGEEPAGGRLRRRARGRSVRIITFDDVGEVRRGYLCGTAAFGRAVRIKGNDSWRTRLSGKIIAVNGALPRRSCRGFGATPRSTTRGDPVPARHAVLVVGYDDRVQQFIVSIPWGWRTRRRGTSIYRIRI